jgi:maltose operon periplasmic protein
MTLRNFPLLLLAASALAACAQSTANFEAGSPRDLKSAVTCCSSYRDMTFHRITMGRTTKFDVTERFPVYDFTTGRSYFAAISLPEMEGGESLVIYSYPLGDILSKGRVLRPIVTFLNEDHSPIVTENRDFTDHYAGGLFIRTQWVTKFKVPVGSKHFIVHSDESWLGKETFAQFTWHFHYQLRQTYYVPIAPVGRLSLYVSKE